MKGCFREAQRTLLETPGLCTTWVQEAGGTEGAPFASADQVAALFSGRVIEHS